MSDSLPFDPTRKPELDKPGPRKALSRVQILQLAIRQKLLCGCGCGAPLDPHCIDEHMVPRETLPAATCDHINNRALLNKGCAKSKTRKDQAVIGHWRRVRGDSGQRARREKNGPQIPSRPFMSLDPRGAANFGGLKKHPKLVRGFDGKVRERS